MEIANPKIAKLLEDLGTLITFAGAAAQSAAGEILSPVAAPASPLTDELIGAYRADEQQDRGGLYRKAVERMESLVAEMKGLDVLVEEAPAAPAPSSGTLPLPPLAPPVPIGTLVVEGPGPEAPPIVSGAGAAAPPELHEAPGGPGLLPEVPAAPAAEEPLTIVAELPETPPPVAEPAPSTVPVPAPADPTP